MTTPTGKDLVSFTVRLPRKLVDQIDEREKRTRRKRAQEIIVLLEEALDLHKVREAKAIREGAVTEL
jgi:metal-responsive CopG/Arc/MetJ family transcriptional regulator